MIKQFIIQLNNNKQSEKAPDRRISAKVGEEWKEIAGGWKKKDKNGNDYIFCKMAEPYEKDGKLIRDGFVIISESEYNQLKGLID